MSSFDYYQEEVEKLVLTSGNRRLMENTLGLVGEAGEVAEKVKKSIRDDYLDVNVIKKELGDVLFYVAALGGYFDIKLDDIAVSNLEKLRDRKDRGVLQGSGDDR